MKTRINLIMAIILAFTTLIKAQNESSVVNLSVFSTKLSAQSNAQIIDARSAEEFALNHINGSLNFNQQFENYEKSVKSLKTDQPVFIYSIGNGRSVSVANDLKSKGFKEILVLDGGIGSWVGGGKPYFTTAKKELTSSEFKNVLASNKLVLVDIGSLYCGSCKKVKPILDSLRKENGAALKILEINLEDSPQLISSLKTVTSFPYLILYRQGEIVLKRSGLTDLKPEIDKAIAQTGVR